MTQNHFQIFPRQLGIVPGNHSTGTQNAFFQIGWAWMDFKGSSKYPYLEHMWKHHVLGHETRWNVLIPRSWLLVRQLISHSHPQTLHGWQRTGQQTARGGPTHARAPIGAKGAQTKRTPAKRSPGIWRGFLYIVLDALIHVDSWPIPNKATMVLLKPSRWNGMASMNRLHD